MINNNQNKQQLAQAEQLIQQLVSQTQQASIQYQHLLVQEQQNARTLEQLSQREQQAAQIIQTALQGHQNAIQQLQQISGLCKQIAQSTNQFIPNSILSNQHIQPNTFPNNSIQ